MWEDVKRLTESDISTILKSGDLSLLLLKTYSRLFMGGAQPSTCLKCMKEYHRIIITKGIKQIEFMQNKTCKLRDGLIFVPSLGQHFSDASMSDEMAIQMLNLGVLKASHFITLPKNHDQKPETLELSVENVGRFTNDGLGIYQAEAVKSFARELTGHDFTTKQKSIEAILAFKG
jgi:hypothetical protein